MVVLVVVDSGKVVLGKCCGAKFSENDSERQM